MIKKRMIYVSVLATLLLSGCGTSKEGTDKQGTGQAEQIITVSTQAPISTLDTTQTSDKNTFSMIQHLFEGLTRLDANSEVVPGLAESYEISDDGLKYTFHIREDAKWSNAEPITANDFVYTWKKMVDPMTQGPNAALLDMVKNSEKVRKGELPVDDLGIEALDDSTFVVNMEYAQPSFLTLQAVGILVPQQEAYVNEQGDNFATNSDTLLYSGPFILTQWDGSSDEWVFEKNENYYDADEVSLEKVYVQTSKEESTGINLFEAGEMDLVKISGQNVSQYNNLDGYKVSLDMVNNYVDFNKVDDRKTSNEDLRRAVALAIDKETLVTNVLNDGSEVLHGLIPNKLYKHPDTGEDYRDISGDYMMYDPEAAKESWALAQEQLGDKVTLEFLSSDADSSKKVTEYIKSQLEDTLDGLTVEVSLMPANNLIQARREGRYDLSLSGWNAGSDDLDFYFNTYASDSFFNYSKYNSKEYTDMVNKAKTELSNSTEDQLAMYQEAEDLLLSGDVAEVPIYQSASNYLINPNVKNIEYPLYGAYYNLRNAVVE